MYTNENIAASASARGRKATARNLPFQVSKNGIFAKWELGGLSGIGPVLVLQRGRSSAGIEPGWSLQQRSRLPLWLPVCRFREMGGKPFQNEFAD
jgi:hypothetical protein